MVGDVVGVDDGDVVGVVDVVWVVVGDVVGVVSLQSSNVPSM